MKLTRILALAAALAGTAALLTAGPDSRTFMQPKAPAQTTASVIAAPATTPANTTAATCATCACCKKAS